MFKRIVVAYDGSEPSPAAAQLAFRIAQACKAKVVLSQVALAGTHGVGGLKPLLGSMSHQLVEHAPCPVLVTKA